MWWVEHAYSACEQWMFTHVYDERGMVLTDVDKDEHPFKFCSCFSTIVTERDHPRRAGNS